VYTPWNGLTGTVNPGQTLILSQTGGSEPCGPQVQAHTGISVVPINFPANENLDTSESYAQSQNYLNYVQGGPPVCSNDGLVPVATLAINGNDVTITDNGQILNDHGVDVGGPICGVEFTANSTTGSDVLTNVSTPQGGTTGLVVNAAITGAGFPNGYTTGEAITAVNPTADTITVSTPANATQGGLIEQELFSEAEQWSTQGVSVSGSFAGAARDLARVSHSVRQTSGKRRVRAHARHSKHRIRRHARHVRRPSVRAKRALRGRYTQQLG
jgi:hypothetical protein